MSTDSREITYIERPSIVEKTVFQLNPGLNTTKTNAIAECVTKYVSELLVEVEKYYPEFKVSELINVGSYKEGTKIIYPDEFDFLAIIENLSEEGCISLEKAKPTEKRPYTESLVNVTVTQKYMDKWQKYHHEGYLRCFQTSDKGIVYNQHDTFGTAVIQTLAKIAKRDGVESLRQQNLTFDIIGDFQQYHRSVLETKEIKLSSAEVHHPNILLVFITEDIKITADLCPAIRFANVAECFDETLCASKTIADTVITRGSILLVGRVNLDFRITFTETEVEYMRDKLQGQHKTLYMYLKYINTLFEKRQIQAFSSYMFKTAVIHHDLRCTAVNKSISDCLGGIHDLLEEFCLKDYIPSIFNANLNLLESKSDEITIPLRKHVLLALQEINKLKHDEEFVEVHKNAMLVIVRNAIEEYDREIRAHVVENRADFL